MRRERRRKGRHKRRTIRCDRDEKTSLISLTMSQSSPPAMVDDDVEVTPGLKLSLPVGNGGERSDDKERATNTSILGRESERGRERRRKEGEERERRKRRLEND